MIGERDNGYKGCTDVTGGCYVFQANEIMEFQSSFQTRVAVIVKCALVEKLVAKRLGILL